MLSYIRKISKLDENKNLSAEFNIATGNARKSYEGEITKRFKGQKRIRLYKIASISKPREIKKNNLCYCSTSDNKLRFFISKTNSTNKGLTYVITVIDNRFNENYLIWFFNHDFVKKYLAQFTEGAIIPVVYPKIFDNIEIPIPKALSRNNISATDVNLIDSPIRKLIKNYHKEYLDNIVSLNYMAAAILAGAIGECILYNYLLEHDIDEKILEGKTYGSLLEFVKVSKTASTDFPFSHFEELQKIRNEAVHPGKAKNRELNAEIEKVEFNCFNNVIKYFGL